MFEEPTLLDADFAQSFKLSRQQFVESSPSEGELTQTGCRYISDNTDGDDLALPTFPGEPSSLTESRIETFIAKPSKPDAAPESTGNDEVLIEAFRPAVVAMVNQVFGAAEAFGIELINDTYITVSWTPTSSVIGEGHFDDDLYMPDQGVSLVAIIANIAGTRVMAEPLPHEPVRPILGLPVDPTVLAAFDKGDLRQQMSEPGRTIVFPQFGQLHGGPQLAATAQPGDGVRSMLVLRANTEPTP